MGYIFRKADMTELDGIMDILDFARQQMLSEGKHQWDVNYPARAHAEADIHAGTGYVMLNDGKLVAYGAVVFTGEPAYDVIKGKWLSEQPYVVLHRIAVAKEARGKGIGCLFMREVERMALGRGIRSFKIDTNHDSYRMRRALERQGFTYCGEIRYPQGVRMAYEKLLK